mmetsp:Transcript_33142/g.53808  ORF Transcript_33142/g.53808 Transcript_33142/m.53808 type:complete len:841 (+) Transcript_33142:42-2564(+)
MSFASLVLTSALAFTSRALEHNTHGAEDNVLAAFSTEDNVPEASGGFGCTETSIIIPNNKTRIHAPDECLDYDFSKEDPVCNGTTFPMLCKFKMVHSPETAAFLERQQMFDKMGNQVADRQSALIEGKISEHETGNATRHFTDYNALLERGMNLDEMSHFDVLRLDETGKRVKGKHEEQYIWAARAHAKASLHASSCKPSTRGKKPARHMDCDLCWGWGFIPHPCRCDCRGWHQHANLCFQPCTEQGDHSVDTLGHYCHKPCTVDGQLALTEGCGWGHTRVCVEKGKCAAHIFNNFIIPVAEILFSAATFGSGTAVKSAMKGGMKALGKALRTGAKNLARKLKTKKFITDQMKAYPAGVQDRILEGGATMLLASNIPSSWGSAALEIAAVVDPTGLISFGKSFVPPASCEEMVIFDEKFPGEGAGGDDDALDAKTNAYDPKYIITQPSRLLRSNVECADNRNEHPLGTHVNRHECAELCASDPKCSKYGTFVLGIGSRKGHCYSEGVKTCKRFTSVQFNFYTINPTYLEKENRECAEGDEHNLGDKSTLEECYKACLDDEKCSQYGTFVYGKGSKRGRCWSEGIIECGRWKRNQYDFYRIGAYYSPRPCPSAYGGGKRLQNGCPEAKPFRYPHNNRCFPTPTWHGKFCNVDPKNDGLPHQRGDRRCCIDNLCLPEFGGGRRLENGCPTRFPYRHPDSTRCYAEACPVNYPYASYDGKICYSKSEYAQTGTGPCESWCTNDVNFGDGCGDNALKLCSNTCPKDYPYPAFNGKICYNKEEYAQRRTGPCESWCTTDKNFGSGCGDSALKLCSSLGGDMCNIDPTRAPFHHQNDKKCCFDNRF